MARAPKAKPLETEELSVEWVDINSIKRYDNNPRANAGAVEKVKASLQEFGWRQPIVVDAEHVIIVGDTRYLAAQRLGRDRIPIHVATNLTPQQIKAYRIADNRTHDEAEWDLDRLKVELSDLDAPLLDVTGLDEDELSEILQRAVDEGDGEEAADEMTELPPEFLCVVKCEGERQLQEIFEELKGRGFDCTLVT